MFLSPQKVDLYSKDGVPCKEVARLIFANFPNGLLVDAMAPTLEGALSFYNYFAFSQML